MTNKLELLLTKLYSDPKDKFYAYFYYQVDRVPRKGLGTVGIGIRNGRIQLSYDPQYFGKYRDLIHLYDLKHEMLHAMNFHLAEIGKDQLQNRMYNIAMDCAINQNFPLEYMIEGDFITLDSFKGLLKRTKPKNVEANREWKYYYELLEKERKEREKNDEGDKLKEQLDGMTKDDHSEFKPLDPLERAMLEDKIRKAAEQAKANGTGNLPGEVEELLKMMKKPTQNWKRLIKQFQGAQTKSNTRATRSRRNRRYGIKVAGKKQDHVARILCVLDTSGSMSGSRTEKVLNELYGAWKNSPGQRLEIVECDTEIKETFVYEGREEFKISGRGGTNMAPALRYAEENKFDGVICLTDGDFYGEELKCKVPSLWIVAENSEYKSPIGQTVNLD